MATAIRMPDFGTAATEVKISRWLVEEGQAVSRGTLLAELETDKATTELECVAEGVVLKLCVQAESVVDAGYVIAYVGAPGEVLPEDRPAAAPSVTPMIRNLAAKMGVDLGATRGTGDGGAITREDVLRASKGAVKPAEAVEEISPSQSAVARAVLKSTQEIPHLRIRVSLDMTAVQRVREGRDPKPGYDAIFLKAMAQAAEAVPLVAAHLEERRIVRPGAIHIAFAAGSGNELSLPVVRDVQAKGLDAIQRDVESLAESARGGRLKIEETTGGCMTLSNLGMYPVDSFDAVIFPGQSVILAVGATREDVVVTEGRIEVRPVVTVTLAADHRLINGRVAAEYVSRLKEIIESGAFA